MKTPEECQNIADVRERRRWAEEENLDPDAIEKLYKDLISYFINREMEDWKQSKE